MKPVFICADEEFLVSEQAQAEFAQATRGSDPFAQEVVLAMAQNVGEVEAVVARAIEAIRTLPMFGQKKTVWIKNINWMGDSVTGRAEGTHAALAKLISALSEIEDEAVTVLLSAYPVDRRRKEFKALESLCSLKYLCVGSGEGAVVDFITSQAKALNLKLEPGAGQTLSALVHGNIRMAKMELEKLSVYIGESAETVSSALITQLVGPFGESEFFLAAEVFFKGEIQPALKALDDHFFSHPEARPLLTTLQGRTRLMIQLRALMDAGLLKPGRSLNAQTLEAALSQLGDAGISGDIELPKSTFNLISQNAWYLGKIAETTQGWTLKRLIACQKTWMKAFEEILARPTEQAEILRSAFLAALTG